MMIVVVMYNEFKILHKHYDVASRLVIQKIQRCNSDP